jgi:anti-sigma factor RsiW
MTCDEIRPLLGPYLDGELDPPAVQSVESHLAGCDACMRDLAAMRALSGAIHDELPALAAPDALRARVLDAVRTAAPAEGAAGTPGPQRVGAEHFGMQRGTRPHNEPRNEPDISPRVRPTIRPAVRPQWLAAAALYIVVGAAAWMLGAGYGRAPGGDGSALRDAVVASHVRSLQASHLIDVASSDRHTVKPWFDGKLDFSPPVPDLATQGFPLVGGRLDYLDGRPVAALVYGRAKHVVNLFIWPAAADARDAGHEASRGASPGTVRGYHVRHWVRDGMTFWAVSDVAEPDLNAFVSLFQASGQPAESVR